MRVFNLMVVTLAVATSTASASAQQRSEDVIVRGKRAPPLETTRAIIRAIVPRVGFKNQIPRLVDRACIKVGGVNRVVASAIADRIAANAAEAGLGVGRPNCNANILILVATDGRVAAREVAAKQAYVFGAQSPELSRFLDDPGPDRLFVTKDLASRDGDRADHSGGGATAAGLTVGVDAPTLKQPIATRIGPDVRRVVTGVILVLDRSVLVGKTPLQIADYATMRVLASARYTPDAGDETILSLLHDGASPPEEMTRIDRSLLVEMYRNRDLQTASAEINAAARTAIRE